MKNEKPSKEYYLESQPMRETAISALRTRGEQILRRGRQLIALANALDEIQKSATEGCNGSDGRHPYIGVGSDAEEALWELITSYRG